jgi:hypothetical protein
MNPEHGRFAEWDSAYVLGALSPAERREYEDHLEACDLCSRSVAEIAPMPGLLSRLTVERATALLDESVVALPRVPSPDLAERVRFEYRRRRRARNWLIATAAAVIVIIASVLVPLAVTSPESDARTVAMAAVVDLPLEASLTLAPVGWGTRIELECSYAGDRGDLADGRPYGLYVIDRDGRSSEVSSWQASPGSTARLAAGTALDLAEIARIEIRDLGSGTVLMRAGSVG